MPTDDLLDYLFDGRPHLLLQSMTTWVESSRRFAAFVTTFRDKIRKKLRSTPDRDSLLDLEVELETAYMLLRERALSVVYEPAISKGVRSPDFAVTFTTSLTFMLEVTRLQAGPNAAAIARLADTISEKLGQMLPQHSNVLLVRAEAADLTTNDIQAAMLSIRQRTERNDSTLLRRYGFRDRSDFFRHYQRLSEILVSGYRSEETGPGVGWINPQARHPLPGKVRTTLYRSILPDSDPH